MIGIGFGVCWRKFFCNHLAECESEKTDYCGAISLDQHKAAGDSLVVVLPGSGLQKGVQFAYAAIEACAVVLFGEGDYSEHRAVFRRCMASSSF